MSQTTCCLGTSFKSNGKQKQQLNRHQQKAQPNEYQKVTSSSKTNEETFNHTELLVEFNTPVPINKRLSDLNKQLSKQHEGLSSSKDSLRSGKKCTLETLDKDIADFVNRVNRLRFIDESSTSSIISTPAGSVCNLNENKNTQLEIAFSSNQREQQQHKLSESTIELSPSLSSSTLTDSDTQTTEVASPTQTNDKIQKPNKKYPRSYLARKSLEIQVDSDSSCCCQQQEQVNKSRVLKTRMNKKPYQNLDQIIHTLNNDNSLNSYLNLMENVLRDYTLNEQQTLNEENRDDVDDERQFTAVLVEDGFIRMSSPVDFDLDEHKSNCEIRSITMDSSFVQCFCKLNNFPNVGSSPLTIENTHDEYPNPLNDDSFTNSLDVKAQCNPYDLSCLSDEDVEKVLEDESDSSQQEGSFEFFSNKLHSNSNIKPQPIIKKRDSSQINEQQIATIKPKVRFNLDLDYEKEREWSRVNKIFGDVSRAQIEWTEEVEV